MAVRETTHTVLRVGLFHLRFRKKVVNKLRRQWSDMVPATFTMMKRKRLEEQSRDLQGKEGAHAHNISQKWNVYNCNFQLFFLRPPFEESALQVSESDSRISISLYSRTTESSKTSKSPKKPKFSHDQRQEKIYSRSNLKLIKLQLCRIFNSKRPKPASSHVPSIIVVNDEEAFQR